MMFLSLLLFSLLITVFLVLLNDLSYNYLKNNIISKQNWDLNICCGKTGCGIVNADIVKHSDVPNFVQLNDIYNLPFSEYQFEEILCSHTIEHVDDPIKFHRELSRIGKKVTYLVPPVWDITAAFNIFEHRWLFITMKKQHHELPPHIRLPFSNTYQKYFGQKIKA